MTRPKRRARKPIDKREFEICERLREARLMLRLSQEEFANQVGISRPRLASYEEGRVPIRFDLALRICRQFILSERWLATGEGDKRILMDLTGDALVLRIPADMGFGRAHDEFLAARYDQVAQAQGGNLRIEVKEGDDLSFVKNLFDMLVEQWSGLFPPEHFRKLIATLIDVGLDLVAVGLRDGEIPTLERFGDGAPRWVQNEEPASTAKSIKQDLTSVEANDSIAFVKTGRNILEALREDLRIFTAGYGAKAKLARDLGVTPQAVSQWIDGTSAPDAENTLWLATWLGTEKKKARQQRQIGQPPHSKNLSLESAGKKGKRATGAQRS